MLAEMYGMIPSAKIAMRASAGNLVAHIDTVYPLAEINKALDHSRAMHTRGKLVLRVDGSPDPPSGPVTSADG